MGQKNVEQCKFFLAVITDAFLAKTKSYLKYCENAVQLNKPMYLIIKEDVAWELYREELCYFIQAFPWRTPTGCTSPILFFKTEKEFDEVFEKIRKDMKWVTLIQSM